MDLLIMCVLGGIIILYILLLRLKLVSPHEALDRLFQITSNNNFPESVTLTENIQQQQDSNNNDDKKIKDLNILVHNLVQIATKESSGQLLTSNYDSEEEGDLNSNADVSNYSNYSSDSENENINENKDKNKNENINTKTTTMTIPTPPLIKQSSPSQTHVQKLVQQQTSKRKFIIKRHIKD